MSASPPVLLHIQLLYFFLFFSFLYCQGRRREEEQVYYSFCTRFFLFNEKKEELAVPTLSTYARIPPRISLSPSSSTTDRAVCVLHLYYDMFLPSTCLCHCEGRDQGTTRHSANLKFWAAEIRNVTVTSFVLVIQLLVSTPFSSSP